MSVLHLKSLKVVPKTLQNIQKANSGRVLSPFAPSLERMNLCTEQPAALADFRSMCGRNSTFLKSILRTDLLSQLLPRRTLKKIMTSYTNKHDRGFYILNDMGRKISDLLMSKKQISGFPDTDVKFYFFSAQTSTSY